MPGIIRFISLFLAAILIILIPNGGVTVEELLHLETTAPAEIQLTDSDAIVRRAVNADTYAATDALGRTLPSYAEAGDVREGKYVGLFYWTWHVAHARAVAELSPLHPVNVTETVKNNPEAVHDLNFSGWGPVGMPHHWNEPLFGFYDTDDRWVLRKHAEMLANAGVDVIFFDNTNGTATWKESYDVLFEVFSEARAQGVNTPKIAFLLGFSASQDATTQLRMLYDDIYKDSRCQNLWFYWEGKPLILAYPDGLDITDQTDRDIAAFFTFRPCNPSYTESGSVGKWGWLSVYPQAVYNNPDGTPEQITVGVAQNHSKELGLTAMNGENIFGRTYTSNGCDTRENAAAYGANFAEQWEYALKVDPDFVFITGFNEWVAGRHAEWQGVINAFPDEYDDAYSRDIEPSKGDLADNYYYQMCYYIRKFKGVNAIQTASAEKIIDIFANAAQWSDVSPAYYAYVGNTFDRDDIGYGGIHYTDATGRNDITLCKVARDSENVYFLAECADDISPTTDPAWMRLFIGTGSEKNWEGFDYVINRVSLGSQAILERSKGGWDWEAVGNVNYSVSGNTLQIEVPKALLGIESDSFRLNFKWSDNMQNDGDIMDFYLYGDTAPLGRFTYQFTTD